MDPSPTSILRDPEIDSLIFFVGLIVTGADADADADADEDADLGLGLLFDLDLLDSFDLDCVFEGNVTFPTDSLTVGGFDLVASPPALAAAALAAAAALTALASALFAADAFLASAFLFAFASAMAVGNSLPRDGVLALDFGVDELLVLDFSSLLFAFGLSSGLFRFDLSSDFLDDFLELDLLADDAVLDLFVDDAVGVFMLPSAAVLRFFVDSFSLSLGFFGLEG